MRSFPPLKSALSGLVALLAVALLLEALARLATSVAEDAGRFSTRGSEDWYVYSPTIGWERRPGFSGRIYGAQRAFDDDGLLSADSKQAAERTRPKVLFLGDSTTFGNEVPVEETFVERLDEMLPDADVINLAAPGYTSFQGRQEFRAWASRLQPAVVVIAFNHNDRRYVLDPDEADSETAFRRLLETHRRQRIDSLMRTSHVYRCMRFLFLATGLGAHPRDPGAGGGEGPGAVRLDTLHARVDPEPFRRNLLGTVDDARRAGAVVILLLLKDNPVWTERLQLGIELLEAAEGSGGRETAMAIETLKTAVGRHDLFSDLARLHLARAYERLARKDDAEKLLTLAAPFRSLHGGNPIHLDREYGAIMREVAAGSGLDLVDAGAMLDRSPGDYYDFCHFDSEGHRKVAEMLYPTVARHLAPPRP